jgi:peptidoglycan/xylan/chitin deacetylase (PgdA/CDA1 family)
LISLVGGPELQTGDSVIDRREFTVMAGGLLVGLGGVIARPAQALATPAPFYTAHVYPGGPVTLSERALREHGENVLALTFDDGPEPTNDLEILRLLKAYQATATFFVIGNKAAGQLDTIKAMVDAGCEIGNHSWSHPMLQKLSADTQAAEMRRTDELLGEAGVKVKWLRPPYGGYDATTRSVARAQSLETILWSVDPSDWKSPPTKTIVKRVTDNMTTGAVILMHSTRANTVQALPSILQHAKAHNFRFVTLTEWKRIMMAVNPVVAQPPTEAKTGTG